MSVLIADERADMAMSTRMTGCRQAIALPQQDRFALSDGSNQWFGDLAGVLGEKVSSRIQ